MAVKNARLVEMREELLKEKEAITKVVDPARVEFDALTQNPRIAVLRKIIIDAKPRLFEIDNELAALARALGPKASLDVEAGVYSKGQ